MRKLLLGLAAAAALASPPAQAQVALGDTGLTASLIANFGSDYLFRGISQTRSRMTYQGTVEVEHSSGVYIGGFLSNVRFLGTDARQEVDVYGGYRFTALETKFDVGAIGYLYPGYTAAPGQVGTLDYVEGYLKLSREFGPVTLLGAFHYSPNFFGRSGDAFYLEGGADWATGFQDIVVNARLGYQWIERNRVFAGPDYAWWSLGVSRAFVVDGVGTLTASLAYAQTDISEGRCFPTANGGQDICGARVLAAISFKF